MFGRTRLEVGSFEAEWYFEYEISNVDIHRYWQAHSDESGV